MLQDWKPLSAEELQQKKDEDRLRKRDWELLSKAQKMEKTNLKKAISIYETFVSISAPYPLPYLRLPIIYRKQKRYADEVRVLNTAISVYEKEHLNDHLTDAQSRIKKAEQLLSTSK